MRIYVACLAAYNAGILHGAWIEDIHTKTPEEVQEEITRRVLVTSPEPNVVIPCPECDGEDCDSCQGGQVSASEEWTIHAYELEGIKIDEFADLEEVCTLAALVKEHGEAFLHWYNDLCCGLLPDEYENAFQETYCGCYKSEEDWAYEYFNMYHEIPSHLQNYIDYGAYARELKVDHYTVDAGDKEYYVYCPR